MKMLVTAEKLMEIIQQAGVPCAIYRFLTPQKLPYAVIRCDEPFNYGADDSVLIEIEHYELELYTKGKDIKTEKAIQTALKENDIYYIKSRDIDLPEKVNEVIYSI